MSNKMLELAKELKADALLTRRYQILKCSVWSDQLIDLCEHVEKISQANKDSTKLIEACCADDAEWHKLLNVREQENSTLISLVIKLADKCTKIQQEIKQLQGEQFNKEQMKLGVLYARNHLISAYFANFINCEEKQFAYIMAQLTHVAKESIDIELIMDDVLACNEQAEEWIKTELELQNEI